MAIKILDSFEDYEYLKNMSEHGLVFVMKHSKTCPVSARAHLEFQEFVAEHKELPAFLVVVQEHRKISDHISRDTGIEHKSPQVLVFQSGKVIWNDSHHELTKSKFEWVQKSNTSVIGFMEDEYLEPEESLEEE